MKIAYLHGLESNINQNDPKIIFLNNNFNEVFTPFINYKDKNTFAKLFSKIKEMNPDIIVGSSMGGYFAYLIGSKLGIETLLFNPAVVSMTLDPTVDDTDLRGTRHNVFLGKNDNVISGKDIRSYFDSNGVGNFKYRSYKGGHRVPEDTFINSIKNITGIKENDSSQINKMKYIKMKHIKTINEYADGNLNEKSDFPVYHNLYSSAINAVEAYANAEGYQLDNEEYGNAYIDAFFKPNDGKTKKDTLTLFKNDKEQKKSLHVQIYNRGNDKFELNMYIN